MAFYLSNMNMQVRFNQSMETLGTRIKVRRVAIGMTQAELSRLSGVAQADISKLENGSVAGSTKVVQLARALDCDPYWLATGAGTTWGQRADEHFEIDGRGGNVVGIQVQGASTFLEGDVEVDQKDPSVKGVILGSGVHDGYALKIKGDRNAPTLRDGHFVIIEYGPIPPGDLGLFHMSDGRVLLRELLRETADSYHVDSANWGARQSISKDLVHKVEHAVAIVSSSRWTPLDDSQSRIPMPPTN